MCSSKTFLTQALHHIIDKNYQIPNRVFLSKQCWLRLSMKLRSGVQLILTNVHYKGHYTPHECKECATTHTSLAPILHAKSLSAV